MSVIACALVLGQRLDSKFKVLIPEEPDPGVGEQKANADLFSKRGHGNVKTIFI